MLWDTVDLVIDFDLSEVCGIIHTVWRFPVWNWQKTPESHVVLSCMLVIFQFSVAGFSILFRLVCSDWLFCIALVPSRSRHVAALQMSCFWAGHMLTSPFLKCQSCILKDYDAGDSSLSGRSVLDYSRLKPTGAVRNHVMQPHIIGLLSCTRSHRFTWALESRRSFRATLMSRYWERETPRTTTSLWTSCPRITAQRRSW